jgi:hypothetical protein
MNKDNKNTEVNDTDKKLHISDVISSLSDNTPSFDDEFIEILKTVDDKKFTLSEMFIAYRKASINGHFRGAGREKYEFLAYIKQNYL